MERNARGAEKELVRSLKRLKTDHVDLYQFHAVTRVEEVEQIFAAGGAMETFLRPEPMAGSGTLDFRRTQRRLRSQCWTASRLIRFSFRSTWSAMRRETSALP